MKKVIVTTTINPPTVAAMASPPEMSTLIGSAPRFL